MNKGDPVPNATADKPPSLDELFAQLGSGPQGLTTAEAKTRLDKYGPNTLVEKQHDQARHVRRQPAGLPGVELQTAQCRRKGARLPVAHHRALAGARVLGRLHGGLRRLPQRDQHGPRPWYVVPADDKADARLIVSQIVLNALKDLELEYPKADKATRDELQTIRASLVK